MEYATQEAITFNNKCTPPEEQGEILFQVKDIWNRYGTA